MNHLQALKLSTLLFLSAHPFVTASSGIVGMYTTSSPSGVYQAPASLYNGSNVAYYGFYQVGSPGQWFKACFDTGSSATWLPSAACDSTACELHTRFNSNKSSTFSTRGAPFSATYVTGTLTGEVFYDSLTVAGLTVADQGLGLAEQESLDFAVAQCDGLFGLGFPSEDLSAPFVSMLHAGLLDQPVFTLWLNPNTTNSYAGELSFGTVNGERYFGNIRYLNIAASNGPPRYWQVQLDQVTVGSQKLKVSATHAIVDSGSTLIYASLSDAQQVNQAVTGMQGDPNAGMYSIASNCSNLAALPTLNLTLAGLTLPLQPQQYLLQSGSTEGCTSLIVGVANDPPYLVLGTPFLRAYYTLYMIPDVDNLASAELGFAAAVGTELSSFLGL